MDIAELQRDIHDVDHAAAQHGYLALVAHGRVNDLLDAMHVRGERSHDDTAARLVERTVEGRAHRALRRRMTLALRIRRIRHHHEHALVAEVGEAAEIRHLAIDWRIVELEVTRMHDHADRRLDGKAHGIGDGVVHADEANAEAADIDDVALHDRMQVARVHAVLFQAALQNAQRQARAIDRHVDLLQHIRQRADVILMTMREHDGLDLVFVLQQIGNIRNNEVDAQHIVLWEHQTRIDDEDFLVATDYRHVLADFPQTAQGDDL